MTTFQQFRKSIHSSRSHSRISEKNQESFMVNLHFSVNEIVFYYDQSASILSNSDLKITNFSNHNIYFRILSNYAQHYEISPSQDILQPSASRTIQFKLKKATMSLNPSDYYPNNFSKVQDVTKKHILEVQWALVSQEQFRQNILPVPTHHQKLQVKVVEPYASQVRTVTKAPKNQQSFNLSRQPSGFRFSEQQPSKMAKSKVSINNEFLMNTSRSLSESRSSLLTTPIIAAVAIVAFIIGFISA